MTPFHTSAPGRLCLFGEHQDYLGLPVIAMAMDRRCRLSWTPRRDRQVQLTSRELGTVLDLDLDGEFSHQPATPFEAAMMELMAESAVRPPGMDVHIASDIPIQAGCSSSTALLTAWTSGWSSILGIEETKAELVRRCHRAEVVAFDGAGGDMDHFACAMGGIHRFGHGAPVVLPYPDISWILGDSGEPKDTQGHLSRCKEARLPLMPDLDSPLSTWTADQHMLAEGTRTNRDLEQAWARRFQQGDVNGPDLGHALTTHHAVLRDVLGLSTPRIEAMLHAAIQAGAWGGKINGSGGGGCMFVCSPVDRQQAVVHAMLQAGAKGAWPVVMSEGVRHE